MLSNYQTEAAVPNASAKKKCWQAFAEFIRLRDASDGYGECISCGKKVEYPNSSGHWHCGHFYPRSTSPAALYFDEKNCNGQCSHCNVFLDGNEEGYGDGLIKRYGEGILQDLAELRLDKTRMLNYEYDEKAAYYRELVRDMKKVRGIS